MEERIIEILDEFVETNIEIPDHVIPAFATVHDIKDYLDAHV